MMFHGGETLPLWALIWVVCSMALVEKPQSFDEKWDGALRWARRAALGTWVCGLTSVGLAWAQARWYVFHPHYLPLCLLFAGLGVSTFVALSVASGVLLKVRVGCVPRYWRLLRCFPRDSGRTWASPPSGIINADGYRTRLPCVWRR